MTCKLNCKRLGMAFVGALLVILVTDFVLHGVLLKEIYTQTASAWRTEADMQAHMGWMMAGQTIAALFLVWIFAIGYEGKGLGEGVRFGLLIGAFGTAHCFIQYAVTPIPCRLLAAWVAGMMVQSVLAGVAAAAIYRK